jgi:signal transduction histidine kinase
MVLFLGITLALAGAHEFRTPLTSLRQLTELLARGRASSEERRAQYYEVLERETERLHRLVESLLDFGRRESGKRQYRFESLDAAELVRSMVAEFQGQVAGRGLRGGNGDGHGHRLNNDGSHRPRSPWRGSHRQRAGAAAVSGERAGDGVPLRWLTQS